MKKLYLVYYEEETYDGVKRMYYVRTLENGYMEFSEDITKGHVFNKRLCALILRPRICNIACFLVDE